MTRDARCCARCVPVGSNVDADVVVVGEEEAAVDDVETAGRASAIGTSGLAATGDVDSSAAADDDDDDDNGDGDGNARLGDDATAGGETIGVSADALRCADRLRRGDATPAGDAGGGDNGLDNNGDLAVVVVVVVVVGVVVVEAAAVVDCVDDG
jgi:hypothetical protein